MLRHFSFWLWHCQMNRSGACKRLGRSTMRYMLCTNQEIYHAIEHHVQQDERRGESLRRLPIFYFFHLTIFILLLLFFFPCPIQLDRQRQKVCAFMVLGCHRCKCCRSDVKIWMAQPFLSNHSSGQHSNNYGTLSSNSTYPFACDYKPFLNSPNQEVYIYIYKYFGLLSENQFSPCVHSETDYKLYKCKFYHDSRTELIQPNNLFIKV